MEHDDPARQAAIRTAADAMEDPVIRERMKIADWMSGIATLPTLDPKQATVLGSVEDPRFPKVVGRTAPSTTSGIGEIQFKQVEP